MMFCVLPLGLITSIRDVKYVPLSICRHINMLYIWFELTVLFPDGVECRHLILLASHSLQLSDLVHLPALAEA